MLCQPFFRIRFSRFGKRGTSKEEGAYVIRIKSRSDITPEIMVDNTKKLISRIGWRLVENHIMNRVERLKRIGHCPVIYIGSAGTQRGSGNTLEGRYEEFSGRHTAMYPIWVLLYFGWKLEFGWKKCEEPSLEEKRLKEKYRETHQGKIPALVER